MQSHVPSPIYTHTVESLAAVIVDNARGGAPRWLSATFDVRYGGEFFKVGVKSYGKWVQRIECCGVTASVPEVRTLTALTAAVRTELTGVLSAVAGKAV